MRPISRIRGRAHEECSAVLYYTAVLLHQDSALNWRHHPFNDHGPYATDGFELLRGFCPVVRYNADELSILFLSTPSGSVGSFFAVLGRAGEAMMKRLLPDGACIAKHGLAPAIPVARDLISVSLRTRQFSGCFKLNLFASSR